MKKGDGKVIVTPFRAQIKLDSQAECAPISLDIPFLIRVGLYIHPAGHMLRSLSAAVDQCLTINLLAIVVAAKKPHIFSSFHLGGW